MRIALRATKKITNMQTQQWGLFSNTEDWNLPLKRTPYNAFYQTGLGLLRKDKKNLLNFNCGNPGKVYGTTLLFTTRKALQAALKPVLEYAKANDIEISIVLENEPLNVLKISNTSPELFISNLSWAHDMCDGYGFELVQGGTMMPAMAGIYKSMLSRKEGNDFVSYMRAGGFYVSGKADVAAALSVMNYCADNGITNNFHSQQESEYLPDMLERILAAHGDIWIANENGVRKEDVDSMIGLTKAIQGSIVKEAILDIQPGAQGMLVVPKEEQKEVFLEMVS